MARSSGSAETQAATQAQAERACTRLLGRYIQVGSYDDHDIDGELGQVGGCLIIYAKGVHDAIHRNESAALSMSDNHITV